MGGGILNLIDRFNYRKKRKLIQRQVGYVILLSDEIHNFMRRLQVGILNQYRTLSGLAECPHITIKQGFQVKALEPFEQYFDRLTNEIEPFEIIINGIDYFDQGIIFLDVEQNTQLKRLRLKVLSDLSEQFGVKPHPLEDERYYFHATLAYNMSKDYFSKALEAVQNIEADFQFVFNTLGLLYFTGQEWITYKRSKVGGRSIQPSPNK